MALQYEGNAEECLKEAFKLCYAYFSPELDNFQNVITVEDILFKVLIEIDLLDDPNESLKEHAKESGYKWHTSRNRAWRRKAVTFIYKWENEVPEESRTPFSDIIMGRR